MWLHLQSIQKFLFLSDLIAFLSWRMCLQLLMFFWAFFWLLSCRCLIESIRSCSQDNLPLSCVSTSKPCFCCVSDSHIHSKEKTGQFLYQSSQFYLLLSFACQHTFFKIILIVMLMLEEECTIHCLKDTWHLQDYHFSVPVPQDLGQFRVILPSFPHSCLLHSCLKSSFELHRMIKTPG